MKRLCVEQLPVEEVIRGLEESIANMLAKYYSPTLMCVDYIGLGKSPEFKAFVNKTLHLQTVRVFCLHNVTF